MMTIITRRIIWPPCWRGWRETGADITKLSAWFVYSAQLKRLGYWDTANTLGLHFTFGPEPVLNAFFNQTAPDNMKNNYAGYGFSYVFKKSMWETAPSRM